MDCFSFFRRILLALDYATCLLLAHNGLMIKEQKRKKHQQEKQRACHNQVKNEPKQSWEASIFMKGLYKRLVLNSGSARLQESRQLKPFLARLLLEADRITCLPGPFQQQVTSKYYTG